MEIPHYLHAAATNSVPFKAEQVSSDVAVQKKT